MSSRQEPSASGTMVTSCRSESEESFESLYSGSEDESDDDDYDFTDDDEDEVEVQEEDDEEDF
jgi:hypothetical protein